MEYTGRDKHKQVLFERKQDKLTAGTNIALTPQQDGTVRIDAEGGGGGNVNDVLVDGVSVVQNKVAYINLLQLQDQINDILSIIGVDYLQNEANIYITDEYGRKILLV